MKQEATFHLDPLDDTRDMTYLRLNYYFQFARILKESGWKCFFVGLEKYKKQAEDSGLFQRVIATPTWVCDWKWYGEYHLMSQNNALPESLQASTREAYGLIPEDTEIFITNTPSTLLRKKFPHALILHYEYGMFSRAPFPRIHQLDPWGYSHKSLLSKYPSLNIKPTPAHLKRLESIKNIAIESSKLEPKNIGSIEAIHYPLQSESNWPIRLDTAHSRTDMIDQLVRLYPSEEIVITEKNSHALSQEERDKVTRWSNVTIIPDNSGLSTGSFQTAYCKSSFTFSPSLTLQTILWENKLLTSLNSSMSLWKIDNPRQALEILASYVGNFSIHEPDDLVRVLNNGWAIHQTLGAT